MCDTYRILIVLQFFLPLASELDFIEQESDFHSDLSCNLHKNYITRVELRKMREEAATTPALDCDFIPDLLNCVVGNISNS